MEKSMSQLGIIVKKRKGYTEPLNLEKLHKMVETACEGLSGVSASQVEMSSGVQFYNGIDTETIQQVLIKSAADLISLDNPNYQFVAARLLLFSIRKSLYGKIKDHPTFYEHIQTCVSKNVYAPEILEKYTEADLNTLGSYIDHHRDYLFTYAGLRQVVDKYLVQDRSTGQIYETPQFMYMMIAATGFANYPQNNRLSYVKRYYDAISKHKLNVPTPIMAGVRTPLKQSASCVLLDCGDSLDSIIATDGAMMKYIAGRAGIGLNIGRLRGIGSKIRGGEVVSTGAIPFLKKFEGSLKSCHQGGVRAAAATVYFPIWHQEIESVIVLKNNKGTDENRVRKLDYNIQFSRIFYERFINNEHITLFSPDVVPGLYDSFGKDRFDSLYVQYEKDESIPKKVVKAQELILDVLKERLETGRIYLMNIDHANSHSPFKDQIVMSNLCVSGDTKIKIKYPEAIYDDIGEIYDWKVYEKEIEIEELEQYICDRDCRISTYSAYEGDPCEDVPQIEVLSYNIQCNQEEWKPITAFAETSPKSKVMKITDEETGKSIVITPEHQVFTKNRGYVMAKDLTETDELVIN
jgi:ribonucleoside-diphosphate reductase alpha chain